MPECKKCKNYSMQDGIPGRLCIICLNDKGKKYPHYDPIQPNSLDEDIAYLFSCGLGDEDVVEHLYAENKTPEKLIGVIRKLMYERGR